MDYPAAFTMHTPSGSTHCCVTHARQLESLMRMLGAHTNAVKAPEGAECANCKNEAAPVVQPDMVMVPREPTEAMLDAAMNRYKHVSPEAKARYTQMHRENFRCDYKAMIAAAEGK